GIGLRRQAVFAVGGEAVAAGVVAGRAQVAGGVGGVGLGVDHGGGVGSVPLLGEKLVVGVGGHGPLQPVAAGLARRIPGPLLGPRGRVTKIAGGGEHVPFGVAGVAGGVPIGVADERNLAVQVIAVPRGRRRRRARAGRHRQLPAVIVVDVGRHIVVGVGALAEQPGRIVAVAGGGDQRVVGRKEF